MTLQQRFNLIRTSADYVVLAPLLISGCLIYLDLMPLLWVIVLQTGIVLAWVMVLGPLIKASLKCPACGSPVLRRYSEAHGKEIVAARALAACHKCGQSFVE